MCNACAVLSLTLAGGVRCAASILPLFLCCCLSTPPKDFRKFEFEGRYDFDVRRLGKVSKRSGKKQALKGQNSVQTQWSQCSKLSVAIIWCSRVLSCYRSCML